MKIVRAAVSLILVVPLAVAGASAQGAPGDARTVPEILRSGPLVATGEVGPGDVTPDLTHYDALRADAEYYAKDYGVSVDEAYNRLVRQAEMSAVRETFAVQFPESYAGSNIEHTGEHRLVIHLTPAAERSAARALVQRSSLGSHVSLRFDAPLNAGQIVEAVQSADVSSAVTGVVEGVGYDMKSRSLVAEVHTPEGHGQRSPTAGPHGTVVATLESGRSVSLPLIQKVSNGAPAGDGYRGGVDLRIVASGITYICTSGFNVVTSGGTRGMTTSAHCRDSQTYQLFGSTSWSAMTFQAASLAQTSDLQWHTTSTQPGWAFYGSSTSSTVSVTGRVLRTSQAGDYVCHRGQRTENSCGTVTDVAFAPSYSGACGSSGSCFAAFAKVEGPNLRCYPGDSGGPVYSGGLAYGWYKGQSSTGTTAADCNYMFHMTSDYVGTVGASILISS